MLKIFEDMVKDCFKISIELNDNFVNLTNISHFPNQEQTNKIFSEKWNVFEEGREKERLYDFQKNWYLQLYGFKDENELRDFLSTKKVILDAGCGLGYKAAWFAELSPSSLVIAMDFSEASERAAAKYHTIDNLVFMRGDIADTKIKSGIIDFVSCDQVIMHTENPELTFSEFVRIIRKNKGEVGCYFYAKKALPRELLDDYFRTKCKDLSSSELWGMSKNLTKLGKILSDLEIEIEVPSIPQLGIKGGRQDLQRFIYWNFIKCFWNAELGKDTSDSVNFDWYSPSNARRFTQDEVLKIVSENGLKVVYFHTEEAAYSGRFGF